MSRPPLPVGTWGSISTRVERIDAKGKPVRYLSKANFRDHDGHVRDVTAFGKNKSAAERALLKLNQLPASDYEPASNWHQVWIDVGGQPQRLSRPARASHKLTSATTRGSPPSSD